MRNNLEEINITCVECGVIIFNSENIGWALRLKNISHIKKADGSEYSDEEYLNDRHFCPECHKKKYVEPIIIDFRSKEKEEEYEKQRRRAIIQSLIDNAQIPQRYNQKTKRNTKEIAYQLDIGKSLFVFGESLTYKTYLAIDFMKRVIGKKRGSALFTTLSRIANTNVRHFDEKFVSPDILLIDDLKLDMTQFDKRMFIDIIYERYVHEKQTIITSSFDPKRFILVDKQTAQLIEKTFQIYQVKK